MRCEGCRGFLTLLDSQTSSGSENWHIEEMDGLEGFSLHNARRTDRVRPFLTSRGRNQMGRR